MLEVFDQQVDRLIQKNYPQFAHVSEESFRQNMQPLREQLKKVSIADEIDIEKGILPFVIVVKTELVSAEEQMAAIDFGGKSGVVKLFPHVPGTFSPIKTVQIPDAQVYLLIGIQRGKEFLNIRPQDALISITNNNRSPLTIDEGIAILVQYPEFLIKNNCFSLLASRTTDQRVPALWISEKRPKLGWCWDGNPHTWLGSASCFKRIGK